MTIEKPAGADNFTARKQGSILLADLNTKRHESEPLLSTEIVKLFFSSKKRKPEYEILETSSLSREEVVGSYLPEKWQGGERNIQNYPGGGWAISLTENGDRKTLRKDDEGNLHFSGIMPIEKFRTILHDLIEDNGDSVGFIDAVSMRARLQEYLKEWKSKVDFSKTKVVFDFKFYKGGHRYKITQVKDFKTSSSASNS